MDGIVVLAPTRGWLWKALGRYLKRDQIDALMKRRKIVLQTVDQQVAAHGESAVFFPWPDAVP